MVGFVGGLPLFGNKREQQSQSTTFTGSSYSQRANERNAPSLLLHERMENNLSMGVGISERILYVKPSAAVQKQIVHRICC